MKNEIEMKQHVLGMLKEFLMGEDGGKFKPKAIEVQMMGKPEMSDDEEEMEEMSDDVADMHEEMEDEDCEDEGMDKKKMSLKDFLASKS